MRIGANSFRGEAPRLTPRELPENAAQSAVNARLQSGDLEPWRQFSLVEQLANTEAVETIYLLNGAWLSWSVDADVARGAIPGDNTYRAYITAPDLYDQPRFTNYTLATTGSEPYPVTTRPLGVPAPDAQPTLVAGVSSQPTSTTIEVIDSGDQIDESWSVNPPISGGFTTALAEEDPAVGNGQPGYRLQADENAGSPAYLYRDFGVGDSQVVEFSFDFRFNSASRRRLQANILSSATGAGIFVQWTEAGLLQVGIASGWSNTGLSALDAEAIGAPATDGRWYTCQGSIVTNTGGTKTVRAAIYEGSAQLGNSVTVTNAFSNSGGHFGFVLEIGDDAPATWQTWIDNILVRGTTPTDPVSQVATSYVVTFVNDLGEESAPSPASSTILKDDGTAITVTTQTSVPSGFSVDYAVETKRIYRAVTGNTGTVFAFVAEIPLSQADYVDELTDAELGDALETELWDLPPDDLRGILALPNGIMVGFRRNQLCFSVQNRPHAWPVPWRLNTDTAIVAIGNIDNTVVIGTEAFPYLASGNDPSAYSMSKLEVPQACVSKRSLTYLTNIGVVFASPDGLIAVSGNGRVANLTEQIFTRRQWQDLDPPTIRSIAHDDVCFFFPDGVVGYALDMKPTGFGLIELSFHARAAHADPLTDRLYFTLDAADEPTAPYLPLQSTLPSIDGSDNESLVYTETFNEGLAPYTVITGVITPFSIVPTPYGQGLLIAERTSATPDTIRRSTPLRLAQNVSLKFKINTVQVDDSGTVGWLLAGALKLNFIPMREAALDPARRAKLVIDGEEVALTTGQLSTGVWYQLDAELSATAGATFGTITRLSDGAVVGSATFALGHAPTNIDQIQFYRDSPLTTSETEFDELTIGSFVAGTEIFEFDSDAGYGNLVYRWRGKLNLLPRPAAFTYCRVKAEDYTNLVLNLYADGDLMFSQPVLDQREFTLPMSDEYDSFEIELVGTSRVRTVQVSENIAELI